MLPLADRHMGLSLLFSFLYGERCSWLAPMKITEFGRGGFANPPVRSCQEPKLISIHGGCDKSRPYHFRSLVVSQATSATPAFVTYNQM